MGEMVLGFRKRKNEEWIQGEIWAKIEMNFTQSDRVRDQLRGKYSELVHEVKKMTKLDNRKFVKRLVDEAGEAAGRNDL